MFLFDGQGVSILAHVGCRLSRRCFRLVGHGPGQPLLPGASCRSWLFAPPSRVVQAALRGEAVQAVRSAPRQPSPWQCFAEPHAAALIAAARTLERRSAACVVLPVKEKYMTRWGSHFARGLAYEHTRLRLPCVRPQNVSQRCIQKRNLAGNLSTSTGSQQHRSVASADDHKGS